MRPDFSSRTISCVRGAVTAFVPIEAVPTGFTRGFFSRRVRPNGFGNRVTQR